MSKYNSILFCDIDGCLNDGKHMPMDLSSILKISVQIKQLKAKNIEFVICTGRPQPYAEAIAQMLGVKTPFIFENGAAIYNSKTDRVIPLISNDQAETLRDLKSRLLECFSEKDEYWLEFGKDLTMSIAGRSITGVSPEMVMPQIERLRSLFPEHEANWIFSSTVIDITPKNVTKATGVKYMLEKYSVDDSKCYAIGDSAGDLPMLTMIGTPMCPFNANNQVKEICIKVADKCGAAGTVELIEAIIVGK